MQPPNAYRNSIRVSLGVRIVYGIELRNLECKTKHFQIARWSTRKWWEWSFKYHQMPFFKVGCVLFFIENFCHLSTCIFFLSGWSLFQCDHRYWFLVSTFLDSMHPILLTPLPLGLASCRSTIFTRSSRHSLPRYTSAESFHGGFTLFVWMDFTMPRFCIVNAYTGPSFSSRWHFTTLILNWNLFCYFNRSSFWSFLPLANCSPSIYSDPNSSESLKYFLFPRLAFLSFSSCYTLSRSNLYIRKRRLLVCFCGSQRHPAKKFSQLDRFTEDC